MKVRVLLCLFFLFNTLLKGQEKVDIVLLGAYQMEMCDWSELEKGFKVKKAFVRDFASHQYEWLLKDLVIKHQPEYCVIHAGIEDFFLEVPVDLAVTKYEILIKKLQKANIKVILSNMFPFPLSSKFDEKIIELNEKLKDLAKKNDVKYLDVHRATSGFEIFKKESYQLNRFGQNIWNNLLISVLKNSNTHKKPDDFNFEFEILSKHRIERILKQSPAKVTVCMLGNSITEGGKWNKLLNGKSIRNSGQGGYTTGQMLWHMDTTVIAAKPTHCFIMAGINDFSMGLTFEVVYKNYLQIIKKLEKAGIQPVIQSTLYQNSGSPNNPLVTRLNNALKQFCEEKKYDYLDINKVLSKNKGLIEKYTYDGTHLKKEGYQIWAKVLTKYLKKQKIKY